MSLSVAEARSILGDDVLAAEDVAHAFGAPSAADGKTEIPFDRDALVAARQHGAMLVLRTNRAGDRRPLTILNMIERYPHAFDAKLLRQAGYQLKDEWGIALEPLAGADTCTAGWALVCKEVLEETCNLAYEEQEPALARFAGVIGAPHRGVRRRTAVEVVYDILLYSRARRIHLLQQSWDWSSSATLDRGYLNVGGFAATGMQILSFSRAVRHGRLGICPTYQPTA